jgi:hypothetical protein
MGLRQPIALVMLALAACAPDPRPLTMPAADGRAVEVYHEGYQFVVNRQTNAQALGQEVIRVTRASAPELGYSDGLVARKVADAYCAGFNRVLNPGTYGKFSLPASWIFEGGCL